MNKQVSFIEGKEISWLEFNLLLTNKSISKSKLISLSDHEEDKVSEWIGELESRSLAFKDPLYTFDKNVITPTKNWNDVPEYFLCLFFDLFGASDNPKGTKLFEKISALAMQNFIGGDVFVFGFPDAKNLNTFLDEICESAFETRGALADGTYKDDGVDSIIIKNFNDSRGGNLYVLLQSTAGGNWTKKKEIKVRRWTNYIHWYETSIISSIATVQYVKKKDWRKRVSDYGIVIDRIRIYNSLYSYKTDGDLRNEVEHWCKEKIAVL